MNLSGYEFGEFYAGLTFMENDFGLNLAYAYWDFDDPGFDLNAYLIDVTREYNGFTFDLSYIDTDKDNDPNADGRVVFSVGWSF